MIGQIIEIATPNKHLSKYRGFLQISEDKVVVAQIPFDTILGIVVTGFGCTHSSNLIQACMDKGISFVICGTRYTPVAFVLPVSGHHAQSERFRTQIATKDTTKNNIWKQIVQHKILNQAWALHMCDCEGIEIIKGYARQVKSGDKTNAEGSAASVYWKFLLGNGFRRNPSLDGVNSLLNYGYTILRSLTARAVCGAGLHPTIGLHHKNKKNSMCLVDDLMEPFRPLVDVVVCMLQHYDKTDITPETKQVLANIVALDMSTAKGTAPLFKVVCDYTKHIYDSMDTTVQSGGQAPKITSPQMPDKLSIHSIINNVDTAKC